MHRKWPTKVLTSNRIPGAQDDTFTSKLPPSIKKVIFCLSYNLGEDKRNYCSTKNIPPLKGKRIDSPVWSFQTPSIKKRDPYSNSINRYQSKTINQKQLPGTKKHQNLETSDDSKKSFEQKKKNREKSSSRHPPPWVLKKRGTFRGLDFINSVTQLRCPW